MKESQKIQRGARLARTLFLLTIMTGCLTPLERFSAYDGGQVVIYGEVTPIEETNIVFVGRTSFRERLPEPELQAAVTLVDDTGNEFAYWANPETGKYHLPGFEGIPGRTYFVRVTLPEGKTYESQPEKMPEPLGTDEIYHVIEEAEYTDQDGIVSERLFLKIYSNHTLPETNDPLYIKWHVEEVYVLSPTDFPDPFGDVPPSCYIRQQVDPQRIILFDTDNVNTSHIPSLHIVSRLIDPTFKERHYFTTYQSILSREAHEYWRQVDIVANQVGSIFDAPPARVRGNIVNIMDPSEEVHGYFQAVNQSFNRFYILPDDLPFRMTLHCEFRPERNYYDYPSECLNCAAVPNSSYNRPPWF